MSLNIKEKLQEYGITGANLGKGVGVFLVVSYSYAFLLFGACYYFRPAAAISRIFRTNKINELMKAKNYDGDWWKKSMFAKWVSQERGQRIGIAFAEMVAIKMLISPVMLPVRLLLTVEILKYWNENSGKAISETELNYQGLSEEFKKD
ncbi:unnamed protein product [Blepharisma stoltei]|uniref:Uncharacterized protein n=1 Tax=Blepharisma stoltei TaxID=1481888 RepID=A0AAU9K9A2_9CILI|nr:unnamed protein product [Blepharisma stoltei]